MGCTCPDCGDWFEVCYNNIPGLSVFFWPFCGHEVDSEDDWMWDEEQEKKNEAGEIDTNDYLWEDLENKLIAEARKNQKGE